MKKLIATLILGAMAVSMSACGASQESSETKATEASTTVTQTEEATVEATTVPEETTTAVIKEGTIELSDASVELADGWYAESVEGDTKVKLVNDEVKDYLAHVSVRVGTNYNGTQGAEYWVNATNGNYGGGKTITEVEYNGIKYYKLEATDEQTILYTDINDKKYLEVAVMMTAFENGESVLNHITLKK